MYKRQLLGLSDEDRKFMMRAGGRIKEIHVASAEGVLIQMADVFNRYDRHIGCLENWGLGWHYFSGAHACEEDMADYSKSPLNETLDHIFDLDNVGFWG